jgi:phospholipase C
MATALQQIDHIFILMMENRSFDHILGYLDAANPKITGIANATAAGYANLLNATSYAPAPRIDLAVPVDPLHEREDIRSQMRFNPGDKMMPASSPTTPRSVPSIRIRLANTMPRRSCQ